MLLTERTVNQIEWRRAAEFLRNETGGRIFSAYFKKADGTMREMVCRTGVKVGLKGGSLPYDPKAKAVLPVFEMTTGERKAIQLTRLVSFNIGGETFILV